MPPIVVLDAMGGDDAPAPTVAGAVQALETDGIRTTLVGRQAELLDLLAGAALDVVDAPEVVAMGEEAAVAVRGKRDASIRVAARLVADHLDRGQPAALVSAGSTGATLAAALLDIGRTPGVRRPAVAAMLPITTDRGHQGVVLVDAGGSPDVQPDALAAHARMGAAYAAIMGADAPRIGLLNVGAEPGKGNALARDAFDLLQDQQGFLGNVEPGAVFKGAVEVVVTDGFTGNIFLKTVEAVAVRAGVARGRGSGSGAALLLGVRGEVLVAHGDAGEDEIAQALRTAVAVTEAGLARSVAERLAPGARMAETRDGGAHGRA